MAEYDALAKQYLRGKYKRRPRFVAIRQTRLAIDSRDAVYGGKTRPLTRKVRAHWVRIVAWFVRCRALRYCEVLEIAGGLGADLRGSGVRLQPAEEWFDAQVRTEFSRRLAADARPNSVTWRERQVYESQRQVARVEAQVQQVLLDGLCPFCGEPLPCEGCGVARYELDGRGGLKKRPVPPTRRRSRG